MIKEEITKHIYCDCCGDEININPTLKHHEIEIPMLVVEPFKDMYHKVVQKSCHLDLCALCNSSLASYISKKFVAYQNNDGELPINVQNECDL